MQGDGEGTLIVMGHTTEEAGGKMLTAQPSRKGKETMQVSHKECHLPS